MALNETTKKQLKEFLKEEQVLTKNDVEIEHNHDHNHDTQHRHATRSFDKFCPDCAEPNPDYKEPEFFCENCLTPIGDKEDLQRAKVCHNCGHPDAITKEEKEEL
jgi:membrane protease subunit (stomatin/prohibitin family)